MKIYRKILILGSGALKIGEAGEFDYSGSQAIKALKEEKIETVLVNPNIATIQTSEHLASKVYFLPVTPYFVEKVVEKEKPDGILLSFGGQTALNCGVQLYEKGVFKKFKIDVLGTPIFAIKTCEDRQLFAEFLSQNSLKLPKSRAVETVKDALKAAKEISYPVIVRAAYSLGGQGSGVAKNPQELLKTAAQALSSSPQILVEEYLGGWKEIEYEVVRDSFDNAITVCNMENFDPMGIHTGESIVVAPSQTLTNSEYHKLREISLKVIRNLKIVGECNIQFALDPQSEDYRIIEVNPRLSRSSALASKATGYPLAHVAAKLALGYKLTDLRNSITKVTSACFEPALDYVVVKIPKWDLEKFKNVSHEIGTEMKSVGEVMAIGRKFEEALLKAIRMVSDIEPDLTNHNFGNNNLELSLKEPGPKRIFAVFKALESKVPLQKICTLSRIDCWFLSKIKNIVEFCLIMKKYRLSKLPRELLILAKKMGLSDWQIAKIVNTSEEKVRQYRKKHRIIPKVVQIDTLAGEFPAKTNYLYLTYNACSDDLEFKNSKDQNKVIVLGSGAYKIGSSVEFDWCAVSAIITLKSLGFETVMLNYNPETVSTDYDICHRLYFEELSLERVLDIYEKEKPKGMIVSMGGQIPNNLALKLHQSKVWILGTSPHGIDRAEDRHKFSHLLDDLQIDQPAWKEMTSFSQSKKFVFQVGYPVLVRPSYVLSGQAMSVIFSEKELRNYLEDSSIISQEHPVVISKFIENARELEVDAVADKGEVLVYTILEHIENAGVHSGDSTIVIPPQKTYLPTASRILEITKLISKALKITGPFNIQFLAKENEVKVIECNLRASRSFPFTSKVTKINFIDLATRVIVGKRPLIFKNPSLLLPYAGVKAPQFSFQRLRGADPVLRVEMASTGEVATLGDTLHEAFLKSILATNFQVPNPRGSVLISLGGEKNRLDFLDSALELSKLGFKIFGTKHTASFLRENGLKVSTLYKIHEKKSPNIAEYLKERKLDLVINITDSYIQKIIDDDYAIRRLAVDFAVPLLTNQKTAKLFVSALSDTKIADLKIKSWDEY